MPCIKTDKKPMIFFQIIFLQIKVYQVTFLDLLEIIRKFAKLKR